MIQQKLELTWIGKEKRPKLEPRILLEDPDKSYHAKHRVSDNDLFDNLLALKALEALEAEFAGKVKYPCSRFQSGYSQLPETPRAFVTSTSRTGLVTASSSTRNFSIC